MDTFLAMQRCQTRKFHFKLLCPPSFQTTVNQATVLSESLAGCRVFNSSSTRHILMNSGKCAEFFSLSQISYCRRNIVPATTSLILTVRAAQALRLQ